MDEQSTKAADTHANAYIIEVYLAQLTFASGKSSPCHPAYQAVATIADVLPVPMPAVAVDGDMTRAQVEAAAKQSHESTMKLAMFNMIKLDASRVR